MIKSTSIHNLNADGGIGVSKKIAWVILNVINNVYLQYHNNYLNIKQFCPDLQEVDWNRIDSKDSPSRCLSNLFWLKLDWGAIRSELGAINIFDTGAGSGKYALKLNEFSKGIDSYLGVDISKYEEWDTISKFEFITLQQQDSSNILSKIPDKTNFIMSQSAIEHFENDLLYFGQIKDFIDRTKNNTIQIHLFPSAACLKLYPWHGIRQYTPRTISKITHLFNSPDTYSVLYELGGINCNKLHFRYITYPLFTKKMDLRNSTTERYSDILKISVEKDFKYKKGEATFYVLVIHSNFKNPIFHTMGSLNHQSI